ncbi:hypothetical protein, conserved [Plasmodium gonderi]|uniref:Programmed cell death protein 2 C-terminal domain-containing protein n=1 Tax=Plasmodium gonderi TaxID=77519 RepID=A0A1Y1JG03_PLAGO|nr:hypothetical protein, conserved [Plasmodium gonderi]GAW81451.1 hypothetical protein, conserved [Plasmodium gonderi]
MYIGVLSDETDNKFDLINDSKFGGDPVWLQGKRPRNFNLKCPTCKSNLTFLFQLSTSYNEYIRTLYMFCCMNSGKCNVNKKNWVCIKGKKKLFENLENNKMREQSSNNNWDVPEICQNENTNENDPQSFTFLNCCSKINERQPIFDFSNDNMKKEDFVTQNVNCYEEKLIDWNSLFSKSTEKQNWNNSFFSNSINKTLNCVNEKHKNYCHPAISNSIQRSNKSIVQNQTSDNNRERELPKPCQMNQTNENIVGGTSYKLPSFYISLIEDDDDDDDNAANDYGKDYLYEKAKKMQETYEECNKQNMKDNVDLDLGNDNDLDDIGDVEFFENDFNGCVKFYSYLSKNYNQILRYSYNGKFLYMYKSTKNYIKERTLTCAHCRNKLLFEMQFFSTFVYQIEKKLEEKKISLLDNFLNNFNVGNAIIFTCEKDCVTIDDMYSYEHVELEIF